MHCCFLGGRLLGIKFRGTCPLSHIPSPILYFIWRQDLTESLSASFLLRLALKSRSSCLRLPSHWDYRVVCATLPGSLRLLSTKIRRVLLNDPFSGLRDQQAKRLTGKKGFPPKSCLHDSEETSERKKGPFVTIM